MAEVTQIVIKIGDKEIPLTLAEARELYQALHSMFGERSPLPPIHVEPTIKPPYTITYEKTAGTVTGNGALQAPYTLTDTRTAKPFVIDTNIPQPYRTVIYAHDGAVRTSDAWIGNVAEND